MFWATRLETPNLPPAPIGYVSPAGVVGCLHAQRMCWGLYNGQADGAAAGPLPVGPEQLQPQALSAEVLIWPSQSD